MPAFSGLYDGVHGDGFSALREQSRPPILRGITRVLMQKRGMHGLVNALGRTAPDTIARVDAERADLDVIGGMEAWPSRAPDAANKVTITNVVASALSVAEASTGPGSIVIDEDIARVPDATEDDGAHSFDTTLNEGYPADDAANGSTSVELVADPLVAPV